MAVEQMQFTLRDLVAHAIGTVRNPQDGARLVMGQNVPSQYLWQMLAVVVALSVVLGQGALILLTDPEDLASPLMVMPGVMAALQLAVLIITVHTINFVGRSMGGVGSFEDALALMVWLQFIMICLQVVQIAAMFIAQPLADMIGLAGLVLFLWLLTNFVAVLHGFKSLGLVFVMIVASALGIIFLLSVALSLIGITAPGDLNV